MKKFIDESWLVLMMAVVFAVLLACAQSAFGPHIERNRRADLEQAVFAVVPDVAKFESKQIELTEVFKCFDKDGQLVGWAMPASGFGFQDKIYLVVGLSPDGSKITGLKVVDNKETPGLGNKIVQDTWSGQYKGLDPAKKVSVVKGPRNMANNEIQAVTGATISSEAVTSIANKIIAEMRPKLGELK